jgi:hypothetical protein
MWRSYCRDCKRNIRGPDLFRGSEEQGKPFVHTCRRFPNYSLRGGGGGVNNLLHYSCSFFFKKKKERQSKLLSYNERYKCSATL